MASSGLATDYSPPFTTYRQYISTLAFRHPAFQFLHRFLAYPSPSPIWTSLRIADTTCTSITETMVPLPSICHCAPEVKTRIVMVSYDKSWNINREVLDSLAFELDLSPCFVWQHLDYPFIDAENDKEMHPDRVELGPRPMYLPASWTGSLEIGRSSGSVHLSAVVCPPSSDSKTQILCIFIRCPSFISYQETNLLLLPGPKSIMTQSDMIPHYERASMADYFWNEVLAFSADQFESANKLPYEFIIPWIRHSLVDLALQVSEHRKSFNEADRIEENESEWLQNLATETESAAREIDSVHKGLIEFIHNSKMEGSSVMQSAVRDFQVLSEEAQELRCSVRDLVARHQGIWSLKESKTSVQQAHSVRRLSQLAYVFLPLTFSASLFSTSVRDLQDKALGTFVLTSVVITLLSLLFWWGLGKVEPVAQNFPTWKKWSKVLRQFALRSPLKAFLLAAFALCHTSEQTEEILEELGLFSVFIDEESLYIPPARRFKSIVMYTSWWGFIWYKIVERIARYTSTIGWQDDRFWKRNPRRAPRRNWAP